MNNYSRRAPLLLCLAFVTSVFAHEGHESGDEPHHGGIVTQHKDIHYEVVAASDGSLQIWFSDVARQELPASVASDVAVEVEQADRSVVPVDMRIGESGEYWIGQAQIREPTDVVRVAFLYAGEPAMNAFKYASLAAGPKRAEHSPQGDKRP